MARVRAEIGEGPVMGFAAGAARAQDYLPGTDPMDFAQRTTN